MLFLSELCDSAYLFGLSLLVKIKLVPFLFLWLVCSSCAKRGCGDFQEIVEQPGIAERVMQWADAMSMNVGVRWKRVGNGRVDMPGDYAVPFDLNPSRWVLAGMRKPGLFLILGVSRLVCLSARKTCRGLS